MSLGAKRGGPDRVEARQPPDAMARDFDVQKPGVAFLPEPKQFEKTKLALVHGAHL
jgi:hypothetical protein